MSRVHVSGSPHGHLSSINEMQTFQQNWCNCKPWSGYTPAARVSLCPSWKWWHSQPPRHLLRCAVGTVCGIFLLVCVDCGRAYITEASVYCASRFAANDMWGDTRKACMEWMLLLKGGCKLFPWRPTESWRPRSVKELTFTILFFFFAKPVLLCQKNEHRKWQYSRLEI